MTRKNKKVCTTLYYVDHFLILASAITGCKIFPIATGVKKYKSIINKKKKKHDKIVLLAKVKLNSIVK